MNKNSSSIQQKLMKVIMLTSGIVLFMTCAAFFVYEYVTAHQMIKRQVSTLGQVVATNSSGALLFDNQQDANAILHALKVEPNIKAAALYDENGKLFAKFPANLSNFYLPVRPGIIGYSFRDSFVEGLAVVEHDGMKLGTLFLRSDMRAMYDRFALYGIIAVLFIVISFIFAWFISKMLQRSISYPILQLADIARIVSDKKNYSVRAVNSSNDEVGVLTDAFNHMLTRIEIQNAEITALNQNLEEKVKKRTRELEMANESLMQQTEFSETILDSAVDLIAVFDTDLNFVTMNKRGEDLYKMPKSQLIGRHIAEVFPQTVGSGMLDDLREALKGEMWRHVNYVSGVTNRHYENFYIPLKDKDNKVYRILVIAHDITDIMLVNEKLQKVNSELEKSNRELEQFAYVASHDLQEPLRKIQTFTELGVRNLHNEEVLRTYLSKVSSSAQRMTELIKAVLNYSRISTLEIEFEPVDVNKIIQSICIDLELLIQEKNATINVGALPVINGIDLQIHQLFLNLITNALKFNDKFPVIDISSEEDKEKSFYKITLSDNGIGFDPKFADKVFSIFQRLHSDKRIAGTGIGLAVCKKIVENHHGTISVESEPGKGTKFFIYFPVDSTTADQLTNISSTNTHAL